MTSADILWRFWQDAIARRDAEAEAARKRAWLRYQHKVEEARAAFMAATEAPQSPRSPAQEQP